ncbi:LOW QUALITY PROTEIN: hypothetical protein V2J09_006198 [Rumex salicifolius]
MRIVDVMAIEIMVESTRLNYLRSNQTKFRSENLRVLLKLLGTEIPILHLLENVFICLHLLLEEYDPMYQDAMAICKSYGHPDLFLTFTCNSKWPEITRFVEKRRNLAPEDRPDIISKVFKIKLDELINDLKSGRIFGEVKAMIYTIEFQNEDCFMLILLCSYNKRINTGEDIDKIISAEIPDPVTQPVLYKVVTDSMMHGPYGVMNPTNVCMEEGKCVKRYPKTFQDTTTVNEDGFPVYKRRDNGRIVDKNGHELDSKYVIPYNSTLLLKYGAHINVEWCNQAKSIKYLFKYITKGNDGATMAIFTEKSDNNIDEIKIYEHMNEATMQLINIPEFYNHIRYVSPCEAAWLIFGFDLHYRSVVVERLSFHLPDEHCVIFNDEEPIDSVLDKAGNIITKFLAWMDFNKNNEEERQYCYHEFPTDYARHQDSKEWKKRNGGKKTIGRIYHVPPGTGEAYYLRNLLNHVKGPTCYEDIRTVNGIVHPSFKEACYLMGLLDDEKEYIDGILEASFWSSAHYLCSLFAMLLLSGSLSRPEFIWERIWHLLSDDILNRQRAMLQNKDLQMSDELLKNYTLVEIEKLLHRNGSSLHRFSSMPFPDETMITDGLNKLIQEELQASIQIPADLLIKETTNPIASIVEVVYPFVVDRLSDGKYFEERTILAPTLEVVEKVNEYIMSLLPGEEKVYFSSDSISQIDGINQDDEDLYFVDLSGIPNHCLRLKVDVPMMLLRNIDQSSGLCNGTRLVVTRLMTHN